MSSGGRSFSTKLRFGRERKTSQPQSDKRELDELLASPSRAFKAPSPPTDESTESPFAAHHDDSINAKLLPSKGYETGAAAALGREDSIVFRSPHQHNSSSSSEKLKYESLIKDFEDSTYLADNNVLMDTIQGLHSNMSNYSSKHSDTAGRKFLRTITFDSSPPPKPARSVSYSPRDNPVEEDEPPPSVISTGLDAVEPSSSSKASGPRKQIQFQLDSSIESKPKSSSIKSNKRSSINLQEKLFLLKADAMKSQKRSQYSTERRKHDTGCCRPKDIRRALENYKAQIYKILERPVGHWGFAYRVFSFTVIMCSIILGSITTLDQSHDYAWSSTCLFWYEIGATTFFTAEYILRVWSSGYRDQYKGLRGRIKFMRRPIHVIELIVLIVNIVLLARGIRFRPRPADSDIPAGPFVEFQPGALHVLRFVQILRFLYVDRHAQSWILLMKVVYKHRFELLTSVYIGVIILLFSSYLILVFEKPYSVEEGDNHFYSFADAVYWSIITMTTIGYGDRSPRTFAGKIIATSLCIVGVAFWTLPGGIIGSGFALKVEQKNKKKQFNRLLPASATLIQAWWRVKATENLTTEYASWIVATVKTFDISKPIVSRSLRLLRQHIESTSSHNDELNAIFSGLDPLYKGDDAESTIAPKPASEQDDIEKEMMDASEIQDGVFGGESSKPKEPEVNTKPVALFSSRTNENYHSSSHSSATSTSNDTNDKSLIIIKLSPEHLILIRTILLLKLFVAKHKFKLAFKPYDFKDVIEQYTQGNMDMMLKLKDIQRRIDQVTTLAATATLQAQANSQAARYQGAAAAGPPSDPALTSSPQLGSRSPPVSRRDFKPIPNSSLMSPSPSRMSPTHSLARSNMSSANLPVSSQLSMGNVISSSGSTTGSITTTATASKLQRRVSGKALKYNFNIDPTMSLPPPVVSSSLQTPFIPSYAAQAGAVANTYFNERLRKIETDMLDLSKKLDTLINLTTTSKESSNSSNSTLPREKKPGQDALARGLANTVFE